jgi:hypothetical protein
VEKLEPEQKALLALNYKFYAVEVLRVGGLVSPVVLELEYLDGTTEEVRVPAEVWKTGVESFSKLLACRGELARVTLDPHLETADVDLSNNVYPPRIDEKRMQMKKARRGRGSLGKNPMQEVEAAEKKAREEVEKAAAEPDAVKANEPEGAAETPSEG